LIFCNFLQNFGLDASATRHAEFGRARREQI
jgi:hypothetical protein